MPVTTRSTLHQDQYNEDGDLAVAPVLGHVSGDRQWLFASRLSGAGIDVTYVRAAMPETYAKLRDICFNCPKAERCIRELGNLDWETGLTCYCPNAQAIDAMIAGVDEHLLPQA